MSQIPTAVRAFLAPAAHQTDTTVAELAERIAQDMARQRTRSAKEFASSVGAFVEALGSVRVRDVRPAHVVAFAKWLQAEDPPLAPSTILGRRWAAQKVMAQAVIEELIESDPFLSVPSSVWPTKRPRPDFESKPLELAHAARLWLSPKVPAWRRVLWATLVLTGVRQGEATALVWGDWRTDRRPLTALRISRSFSTRRREISETKTNTVEVVPVHRELETMLRQWRETGWSAYVGKGKVPTAEAPIIPRVARDGTLRPYYQAQLLTWLKTDLEALGLAPRRLHDLRHTFVNVCSDAGVDPSCLFRWTHERQHRRSEHIYRAPTWERQCVELGRLRPPKWAEPVQLGLL